MENGMNEHDDANVDVVDKGPRPTYGTIEDVRLTADEMDERRQENVAYEYLCHLEEAKIWIEACINDSLPPAGPEFEEGLQNGVYLAKLAHFMKPELVKLKKIYDRDQTRYQQRGLHFRHTDNINWWIRAMEELGLPEIFYPETTDIYDRKNMPRTVYCIHALSLYMFKLGLAPQIEDLYGKIKFTEEEISAMRKELDKYGIQMPTFSKIGGILANEMPVDEAALHAAIIAINEAIDKGVATETLTALQNPAAHLVNTIQDSGDEYQEVLHVAKQIKSENTKNRSIDPDYEPDVYDELLTQAEIQGNLNKVNTLSTLISLNEVLNKQDADGLLVALQSPLLSLKQVQAANAEFYLHRLTQEKERKINNGGGDVTMLDRDDVQTGVIEANKDADVDYQKMLIVTAINEALVENSALALYKALSNPKGLLPTVFESAQALYYEEFVNIRDEKQTDLDYDEVLGGVKVLSAIARINQSIDAGDDGITFNSLTDKDAHIQSLDANNQLKYQEKLASAKSDKSEKENDLLTHYELQECIDLVNQQAQEEQDRIVAVGKINEALEMGDPEKTLETLKLPEAKLKGVKSNQCIHYHNLLSKERENKTKETGDKNVALWWDCIQDTVKLANKQADEAQKMSVGVAAINIAIDENKADSLITTLSNNDVFLHSVTAACTDEYHDKLREAKHDKNSQGDVGSGWMMNRTREGHKFYFNINTMEYAWERPSGVVKDNSLLTRSEIQNTVKDVTAAYDREALFKSNEPFIIKLQSIIRGHLVRKAFHGRLEFMRTQLPAIVKLQSWYKGQTQKSKYQDRLKELKSHEDKAILLQSYQRMWKKRKEYLARKKFFAQHEDKIVFLQSLWRTNMARHDYIQLMHSENPPLSVVRKFVHLLDQSDVDYSEEIDTQKLRQQVVTEIRANHQLEHDLDQMDIKIGLLVKNRITLQDVISHDRKLKSHKEQAGTISKGIKSLSKESRERLEGYQHLFYVLQTNPTYLAKLIFEMPQSRTTKFMESVILTLYNYASNQREEFLLLKLFKTALEEEIRRISKVDKMSDIVTGNPLVVKMIVGFNRNARGQSSLRELLNPLVKGILEDKSLKINTNPTEVYKTWINQVETETGKASGLPYDATNEEALGHAEVREKIDQSVASLRQVTDTFLSHILKSLDKIPYGMRYMAKVMRNALRDKFPEAPEKDVLKIVGNLLYYRYINSAIVAPDAFDIIDVSANKGLNNDQRRNLGSIAKILQFAASNKGFGGDSAHLSDLNGYIREAHDKFKQFFISACEVDEPEVKFNMDQYSDVTRVTKPIIYISVKEIIDTHQLLLDHQDVIAPDHNDPLHELLEDLGEFPDMDLLVGVEGEVPEAQKASLEKTEISLTLSNKFEGQDDDKSDIKNVLTGTKRMVVDVIRCQPGETLTQILDTPATDQQEEEHAVLIKKRELVDRRATAREKERETKLARQQSKFGDTKLPLEGMKNKIRTNLKQLELAGIVSSKDNYQALNNMIAQDIRNQRRHRQRRKQEMVRLHSTLSSLDTKKQFYQEQIDYYNQYVKTCLDNLSHKGTKEKRSSWFSKGSDDKNKKKAKPLSIKYNAAKLLEKGVILEIEGIPQIQFKNVLFEINTTDDPAVFDVNAKVMGVTMDKIQLVFQDLLQLQYEGVAVMKMFDRAKVNVNLLIFLLNKKFYGK